MAPRANWKGYLKLSLVSCAVALYPASTASTRVSFHTLNRETGHRLRRLMVDEASGEPVPTEEQVRGYEVSKGDYVVVEDEELDAVALESTHTIDIERFVPRDQIDALYVDAPYYIAPDDKVAEEAFAVIREAMRGKNVVGLARVVLYRRERIIMLEPRGRGLFACILRYPYEVRQDDAYFEAIPDAALPPDMIDLAGHIIERMRGDFDPESFKDRYEEALIALVRAKQAGRALPDAPHEPRPSNVVSLMDALRRSIAAEAGAQPAGKTPGGHGKPAATRDDAPEPRAGKPARRISAADMPAAKASGRSPLAGKSGKAPSTRTQDAQSAPLATPAPAKPAHAKPVAAKSTAAKSAAGKPTAAKPAPAKARLTRGAAATSRRAG